MVSVDYARKNDGIEGRIILIYPGVGESLLKHAVFMLFPNAGTHKFRYPAIQVDEYDLISPKRNKYDDNRIQRTRF